MAAEVALLAYDLRTRDKAHVSSSEDTHVEMWWDDKTQQYKAHCTRYTFGRMDWETGVRDRWEDETWYASRKSLREMVDRLEGDGWEV